MLDNLKKVIDENSSSRLCMNSREELRTNFLNVKSENKAEPNKVESRDNHSNNNNSNSNSNSNIKQCIEPESFEKDDMVDELYPITDSFMTKFYHSQKIVMILIISKLLFQKIWIGKMLLII
ncbi:hypothetical protein BCR32DRAFT_251955 [Anaeromyces robustus]|uniref:Uncharacterized protein n=1 Tax=Anaeromyces robustus TaxID=1754192 RepID=A0A1Y1UXF7_9FUNG|nr:hypothetical protein BCR32DRAFT_251955 [Anaeromyces robustus]|eukprot:ORX42942.1 hypothetical protein BCR32DRAFT_251955 [Anaeromyces robustus]